MQRLLVRIQQPSGKQGQGIERLVSLPWQRSWISSERVLVRQSSSIMTTKSTASSLHDDDEPYPRSSILLIQSRPIKSFASYFFSASHNATIVRPRFSTRAFSTESSDSNETDAVDTTMVATLVAPPHILQSILQEADRILQRCIEQEQDNPESKSSMSNVISICDDLERLLDWIRHESVFQSSSTSVDRQKSHSETQILKQATLDQIQATLIKVVALADSVLENEWDTLAAESKPNDDEEESRLLLRLEGLISCLCRMEFFAHLLRRPIAQSQYKQMISHYMRLSMSMTLSPTKAMEAVETRNHDEEVTTVPTINSSLSTSASDNPGLEHDDDEGIPADAVLLILLHHAKYHHGWNNNSNNKKEDGEAKVLVLTRHWFEPLILENFLKQLRQYEVGHNSHVHLVESWSFLLALLKGMKQEFGITQLSSQRKLWQIIVSMLEPAWLLSESSNGADEQIGKFMVNVGEILEWLEPTILGSDENPNVDFQKAAESAASSAQIGNGATWVGDCNDENLWSTLDAISEDLPNERAREIVTQVWRHALLVMKASQS